MNSSPFKLFSWHGFFLAPLLGLIRSETDDLTGNAVIVFPNDRPRRYFLRLFAETASRENRAFIMPQMLTSTELVRAVYNDLRLPTGKEADTLDCVAVLWDILHTIDGGDGNNVHETEAPTIKNMLASMKDKADFFPWGIRLTKLFEECMCNAVTPADISYTDGIVAPFAAALLDSLGKIFHAYTSELERLGYVTDGLTAWRTAEALKSNHSMPDFLSGKSVFLAGFGMLNGIEDLLFRILWRNGAKICIHADPALAQKNKIRHHSCEMFQHWMDRWHTSCEIVSEPNPPKTEFLFFAGHDLHSQLKTMQKDFTNTVTEIPQKDRGMVAVALTHSDALLPVLHALPVKDCNISLGYPFAGSRFSRLIEIIFTMCDRRHPDGTVYWRDLAALLKHPYLRMLSVGGQSMHDTLNNAANLLSSGTAFVHADHFFNTAFANSDNHSSALIKRIWDATVTGWLSASTLDECAVCLQNLCDLLIDAGNEKWSNFPLDAEELFRVYEHIIPHIKNTLMSHEALGWPLLRRIINELLKEERIPFEADPITGVQVLGMLETRLLRFSHVFIVDATEDHLPGAPVQDPLLPDTLRSILGLPASSDRETLAAYTFHRLIAGAEQVFIYWQEGIQSGPLTNGRKRRSRFAEELIWQEELRTRSLLTSGTLPLRVADAQLTAPAKPFPGLLRENAQNDAMRRCLARPLSATALDTYLTCPLKFYYEHLCRIAPPQEVAEGDDPAAVGELLHTTLYEAYKPWKGKLLDKKDLSAESVEEIFINIFNMLKLEDSLPPENAAMLRIAGPERLRRYIKEQPPKIHIVALEEKISAQITVGDSVRTLQGRIDRIDSRDSEVLILDYKTGSVRETKEKFWEDASLWDQILSASKMASSRISEFITDADKDILPKITEQMPTLQLPVYLYITRTANNFGDNAAFVELRSDGKEKALFSEKYPQEKRIPIISDYIPALLRFILLHMEFCPEFRARPAKHCMWCSAARYCEHGTFGKKY